MPSVPRVLSDSYMQIKTFSVGKKSLLCGMPALTAASVIAFLTSRGFHLLSASLSGGLAGTLSLAFLGWCWLKAHKTKQVNPLKLNKAATAQVEVNRDFQKNPPTENPVESTQKMVTPQLEQLPKAFDAKEYITQFLSPKRRDAYLAWDKAIRSVSVASSRSLPKPSSWSDDLSLQATRADWQWEVFDAQALCEMLPNLYLGGHSTPKMLCPFNQKTPVDLRGKSIEFGCVIRATNTYAEPAHDTQWQAPPGIPAPDAPKQSPTVFQFSGNTPTRDVGIAAFTRNDYAEFLYAIRLIDGALHAGERVFVMCQQGKDRSATVIAGYLIWKYGLSVEDALLYIRCKRFIAEPSDAKGLNFKEFLHNFHVSLQPKS